MNSDDSSDVENIMVVINKFPVQIIALENCNNTLDQLFVNGKISQEELSCSCSNINDVNNLSKII